MKEFYRNEEDKSYQIKYLLKKHGVSSTNWRKLKQTATFYIDNQKVAFNTIIYPNEQLLVEYSPQNTIVPEAFELELIYEDDYLLIVNKPAGILAHPTVYQPTGTLANFITYHFQKNDTNYAFHPVSRLDKDTSGVVLIAKTTRIHYLLSKIHIEKTYIALLNGLLPAQQGFINLPIGREPTSIIERKIDTDGKQALTYYKLLKNYKNLVSLVQLKLLTGRTHQIRVHTKQVNCPIYGDGLYSTQIENTRQFLHAQSLEFTHPITKNAIKASVKIPSELKQIIRKFL